jgi:hypothetical protein
MSSPNYIMSYLVNWSYWLLDNLVNYLYIIIVWWTHNNQTKKV